MKKGPGHTRMEADSRRSGSGGQIQALRRRHSADSEQAQLLRVHNIEATVWQDRVALHPFGGLDKPRTFHPVPEARRGGLLNVRTW